MKEKNVETKVRNPFEDNDTSTTTSKPFTEEAAQLSPTAEQLSEYPQTYEITNLKSQKNPNPSSRPFFQRQYLQPLPQAYQQSLSSLQYMQPQQYPISLNDPQQGCLPPQPTPPAPPPQMWSFPPARPPLNNCCVRCGFPICSRRKSAKAFTTKTKHSADQGFPKFNSSIQEFDCSNPELEKIIKKVCF